MIRSFSKDDYYSICDNLAKVDEELKWIIQTYGYPPLWTRLNNFETLVHIILEQQVSLPSALAALNKLREKLGVISPEGILLLTDEELRSVYFSRQKMGYVRHLALAVINGSINFNALEELNDNEIRTKLQELKGIGNWTIDVYLMFALQRADLFPMGDLAAVNALKKVKKLGAGTPREKLLEISSAWAPYRTVATMILWHYYLSLRIKNK